MKSPFFQPIKVITAQGNPLTRVFVHTSVLLLCIVYPELTGAQPPKNVDPKSAQEIFALTERYCGSCHALPSPDLLPQRSWPAVIDTMVDLGRRRTGQDVIPADVVSHIKALYYGSSPEQLPRLPYTESSASSAWSAKVVGERSRLPQILNLQPVSPERFGSDAAAAFLVSDGDAGEVRLLEVPSNHPASDPWRETTLGQFTLPIQTRVLDYTGNGQQDVVVADLGELPPSGALAGKLFLLAQDDKGRFERRLLYEGLGRISDVQVLDINEDGRLDLVVAVFGGNDIGGVLWLENRGNGRFARHDLLSLSGALNIVQADLNDDGLQDLVTLVAQEHEVVIAFINEGSGQYRTMELARAPHPMYGFTQLQVADLNSDGRPDLLMTNGDAFDTQNDPKPYHGVQWLENRGDLQFQYRNIARYYGAAKATVADMNNDGHQDVLVSSWVNHWDDPRRQSMVWFENNGDETFRSRPLAGNRHGLVPMVVTDLNRNGRPDVLAGAFRMDLLRQVMTGASQDSLDDGDASVDQPRLYWFEAPFRNEPEKPEH